MYTNELYHFGVKGQKWGVRRYQNKDGSLTSAGKKRLQKQDARYTKFNPSKAKYATELRNEVIKSKKESIDTWTKLLEKDSKMANIDVSKINFDKEAEKQLKEQLDYLKEQYADGYSSIKNPTKKDAIDSFYMDLGMIAPKGATEKDVAQIIKADTIIFKQKNLYSELIQNDKENISRGERIINSISEMSLKDIYDNRNDMHYSYWKDRGYYN